MIASWQIRGEMGLTFITRASPKNTFAYASLKSKKMTQGVLRISNQRGRLDLRQRRGWWNGGKNQNNKKKPRAFNRIPQKSVDQNLTSLHPLKIIVCRISKPENSQQQKGIPLAIRPGEKHDGVWIQWYFISRNFFAFYAKRLPWSSDSFE